MKFNTKTEYLKFRDDDQNNVHIFVENQKVGTLDISVLEKFRKEKCPELDHLDILRYIINEN